MTNKWLKLTLAVAVGFFALGLAPTAQGAQTMGLCLTDAPGNIGGDCVSASYHDVMILSDGTIAGTTIVSNGVAAVLGANVFIGPNSIIFQGAVGGWSVNVSTGQNFGPTGGVDLNSVDTYGGTLANTLDIYFESIGNAGTYTAQIGGTNPNGGSTTYDGCATTNSLLIWFCPGNSDVGSRTFTATGGFSANYGTATSGAPFGLTEQLNLVAAARTTQTFSGDYALAPVPEPTSILLLGGVLVIAGRSLRKKYQKAA